MHLFLSAFVGLLLLSAAAFGQSVNVDITITAGGTSDEEFVGPLANWIDAKTGKRADGTGSTLCTGSTGDGTTDDRAALQSCLDQLSASTPVLYLPAPTVAYKITKALSLYRKSYINIIGADPVTTIIKWAGNSAATDATLTGTVSQSGASDFTLTATVSSGQILPGQILYSASIGNFARVVAQLSGTPGGTGTYKIGYDTLLTIASPVAMTTRNESMVLFDGLNYSRVDRLTFDGNGNALRGIDQAWDNTGTGTFDTGNQYADNIFKNFTLAAFSCGGTGYGCAETAMLRSQFLNNQAGIQMNSFNALDMFVRHSRFTGNYWAISNYGGAGNFHAYNNIFDSSTNVDMIVGNTQNFTMRNNYSVNSNYFFYTTGSGNVNGATIIGNTIVDTISDQALDVSNYGPVVLLDNVIRSRASAATATPVVAVHHVSGSDVFSMGNTFTIGDGSLCGATSSVFGTGHCHQIQDQIVSRASLNPIAPTLPGTPPNLGRTIYEATSVAQIVSGIASAAGSCNNSVVHIQPGNHSVTSTIVVPANCAMQIIGDGYNSRLQAAGANPVMRLQGPSKAVLRDFSINGNVNTADGLEIANADQVGSRVFMEGPFLAQSTTNLFVDATDYTLIEAQDLFHSQVAAGNTSIVVTGGAQAAAGNWKGGAVNLFGNASSNIAYKGYSITNGAHVMVDTIWFESGVPLLLDISGLYTTATYAGSRIAAGSTNISANNFRGTAAFINLLQDGDISISGNGSGGKVLGLGLVGQSSTFFGNTSSPAVVTEFLNGRQVSVGGLTEQGCCDTSFLTDTLKQFRVTSPSLPKTLPSGITDARLYRVFVDGAITGVWIH